MQDISIMKGSVHSYDNRERIWKANDLKIVAL